MPPAATHHEERPFDAVDFALMLMTAIIPPHWPFFALLFVQTIVRRSPRAVAYILEAVGWQAEDAPRWLLPGAALLPSQAELVSARGTTLAALTDTPAPFDQLSSTLARLPQRAELRRLTLPESTTSIVLGVDPAQRPIWLDLHTEAYHIGLYGQTGAGKDMLLRCWFILLAKRNPPDRVQFVVIDGKGDWLIPQLAPLAHMFIPPAGGYGRNGDTAILKAVEAIDREAERRQALIQKAGCTNRDTYIARTGATLPLLIIIATDVMTNVAGEVEALLIALVSKARSLGMRVIVSMQSPTGRDTRWRGNLSTIMAGALQSASQDTPALGLPASELRYRPSQLPPPQQRPGIFVVRASGDQALVQAPYLSDEHFATLCATLPQKLVPEPVPREHGLLSNLLSQEPVPELVPARTVLADTEAVAVSSESEQSGDRLIITLLNAGHSANEIAALLGGNRAKALERIRNLRTAQGRTSKS